MFKTDIASPDKSLVVSYTFKQIGTEGPSCQACLYLNLVIESPSGGKQKQLILAGDCDSGKLTEDMLKDGDVDVKRVESMDLAGAWMRWDSHEFNPDSYGWTTR